MPRPKKLNKRIIKSFREILSNEMNVLMCTDWDLCHLLNKNLKRYERISYRTFQRYKRDAMIAGHWSDDDTDNELRDYYEPVYDELFNLFADALINQKRALGFKILNDEKNWRRYQWTLERKFKEWNIRWSNGEADRNQRYADEDEQAMEEMAIEEMEELKRERRRKHERNGNLRPGRDEPEKKEIQKRQDIPMNESRSNTSGANDKPPGMIDWENYDRDHNISRVSLPVYEVDITMDTTGFTENPDGPPPAPPEPDKPLPFWKRPGYEPSPDRLRRLW